MFLDKLKQEVLAEGLQKKSPERKNVNNKTTNVEFDTAKEYSAAPSGLKINESV